MSFSAQLPRVSVRVPAKINLELLVGPLRDDGFHDLATVFHAVGLFDVVTAEPADTWGVTVTGSYAEQFEGAPAGENLALKAARLLARHADEVEQVRVLPVHLTVNKEIPVAAGMAGGSADAAGALVACDALWGLDTPVETLHELAAQLGSDVNFALTGGTAIGTGRGEQVTPALIDSRFNWVVVTSSEGLSTPAVFRELDRRREGQEVPAPATSAGLLAALRSGDPEALGAAMTNDMQAAAVGLLPQIQAVLNAGDKAGAVAGLLSGSGPTCVFLARSAEHARELRAALDAAGVGEHVIRTSGPARGAHVISDPNNPGPTPPRPPTPGQHRGEPHRASPHQLQPKPGPFMPSRFFPGGNNPGPGGIA